MKLNVQKSMSKNMKMNKKEWHSAAKPIRFERGKKQEKDTKKTRGKKIVSEYKKVEARTNKNRIELVARFENQDRRYVRVMFFYILLASGLT
jgi:hypothetical protein